MVVNSQGIPFFVEFGSHKIASIDPHTMAIREYILPNAESRPRRIAITRDDVLWYSDYARGYLGRFDAATGKASEWPSPGGSQSQPYRIAVVKDVLWYSEAGVKPNTVVRFDPKTETFQSWVIPSGGGVVPNMDVTRDGNLVLACSGGNGLARGPRAVTRHDDHFLKPRIRTPAPTKPMPTHSLTLGRSWRKMVAKTATSSRLNLSTGATFEASPICKARK